MKRLTAVASVLMDIISDWDASPVVWGASGTRVRGTYYDGYGVLFLVEGGLFPHRVHVTAIKGKGLGVVLLDDLDRKGLMAPDIVGHQKERIIDYLGNYAGTIRQFKPNDRISIRIRKDAVTRYSQGKSNIAEFMKQIEWQKI